MADAKVTTVNGKATPTERTQEADRHLAQGCSALYDVQCAFESLTGLLAQAEEYGMETIIRALSSQIGQALDELEQAEVLFRPEPDCAPYPNTPGGDIPDEKAMEMVKRVLESKGGYADKLKGMVETIHHGVTLDTVQAAGGAQ